MRQITVGRSLLFVYGVPLFFALFARAAIFYVWTASPLTHYSRIPGLDMQTLLEQGRGFFEGQGSFSLFNVMVAATCAFNDGTPSLTAIVIIQMLLGVLGALLVTHSALRLTGKRTWAMASGLIAGIYAPSLIYECVSLKESLFLFAGVLSLAAALECRRRHFRSFWPFLAGLAATGPVLVRMAGAIWTTALLAWLLWMLFKRVRNKREHLKSALRPATFLLAGAFCLIAVSSLINKRNCGSIAPFNNNVQYILSVGASSAPETLDNPASSPAVQGTLQMMRSYAEKISDSFRAFEIADNLNYYFIRELIPPLLVMPGPLLLLPLAVSSLLLMLLSGRVFRKEGLIFLYLIAFLIPFCVFVPLARYRLALLPALAIAAPFGVFWIFDGVRRGKRLLKPLFVIALYCLVFYWAAPRNIVVRASDFSALGFALEAKHGSANDEALGCFIRAHKIAPDSARHANNLARCLIERGFAGEALGVLVPVLEKNPGNYKASLNCAVAYNALGRGPEAEKMLRSLSAPEPGHSRFLYFFHLGESLRLQDRKPEAAAAYTEAAKHTASDTQRAMALKLKKSCE